MCCQIRSPCPFAPPCILHLARPATAGAWHGVPERVFAPQRAAERSCGGSLSEDGARGSMREQRHQAALAQDTPRLFRESIASRGA
jgi:hypothetical protein